MNLDKENVLTAQPLAFVVHTPAKKAPLIAIDDDESEEIVLKLQKFAEIPWLNFGTVKVGKTKKLSLVVQNDESVPQDIVIEKFPSEKAGFVIDTTLFDGRTLTVPSNGFVTVDATWTPVVRGNQRETITFKWQGKYRLQAILYGQANTMATKKAGVAKKRLALKPKNNQDAPAAKPVKRAVMNKSKPATRSALAPKNMNTKSNEEGVKKTKKKVTVVEPKPVVAAPKAKLTLKKKKAAPTTNKYRNAVATSQKDVSWWLSKVEDGFAQWLNYIVAPDSNLVTVGSNRRKSMQNFQRAREESHIRKLGCRLYRSSQIEDKVLRIEQEIEGGLLKMRSDKDLDADLGLRDQMIDFLMTYHPVWLRLGLETVYGTTIKVAHADDTASLRRFLRENFLYNDNIGSFYQGSLQKAALLREEMREAMHRFTLKRFFSLVLFLDVAKQARIHPSDPVLFDKESDIKSSTRMLANFSSRYLSGEGDVLRHLNFLGYQVSYEQTFLEEFDYSIKNLAVDLTDGLRLTRLLEVLTDQREHHSMTSKLRTPVTTREQRVYNVQQFLNMAAEHGLRTRGLCTAKDIANGHREKTLALLWHIMMNWKIPALIDSEQLNNEILRIRRVHNINERRESQEAQSRLLQTEMYTDDKLQMLHTWVKTVCATFGIEVQNFTSSFADGRVLCLMVHYYLPHVLPLEDIRTLESWEDLMRDMTAENEKVESKETAAGWSATFSPTSHANRKTDDVAAVQHFNYMQVLNVINDLGGVPTLLTPEHVASASEEKLTIAFTSYLCARLLDIRREVDAAETIQCAWRHRVKQRRFLDERVAAKAIQATFRGFVCRKAFKQQRTASVVIQKYVRGFVQRQRFARDLEVHRAQTSAAVVFQKNARRAIAFNRFQKMRNAVITIQSVARSVAARKQYLHTRQVVNTGVARMQAVYRMRSMRKEYEAIQASTAIVNRVARGFLVRSRLCQLNHHATKIQAFVRSALAVRAYAETKQATVTIQRIARGFATRRQIARLSGVATKIQAAFRCYQAVQVFKAQKSAAIRIQASFRRACAVRDFAQTRSNIVKVQALYRARAGARQFAAMKTAAVKVQSAARMMTARARFVKTRRAVVVMQKHARGFAVRRHVAIQSAAAVAIQAIARGVAARHLVRQIRAASLIQCVFRGYLAHTAFAHTRRAATMIQKIVRGRQQANHYQVMKRASVVIQAAIRKSIAVRQYEQMKSSAVRIQSAFRRHVAMKSFVTAKNASVTIQSTFRGFVQRSAFKQMRSSAIGIQALVRGAFVRAELAMQSESATKIQAVFRGYSASNKYATMKKSAALIQSVFRGYVAHRNYCTAHNSVVTIQCVIRGAIVRSRIAKQHEAATIVQSVFKGYVTRQAIAMQHSAATKIAAASRGFAQRAVYKKQKTAAVRIQSVVRASSARLAFVSMKNAAIVIQAAQRASAARQSYQALRNAAITVQAYARAVIARRQYRAMQFVASKMGAIARGRAVRMSLARVGGMSAKCVARAGSSPAIAHIPSGSAEWVDNVAAIVVQRAFRAFMVRTFSMAERQARVARAHNVVRGAIYRRRFVRARAAIVTMQRNVRARQHAKQAAVSTIQRIARGFLGRLAARKWSRGIVAFQSVFRGFQVRRHNGKTIQEMRARIAAANAAAEEEMRLGNRTNAALNILLKHSQMSVVMKACQSLDVATKFSRVCCERMVDHGAISVIFRLIKSCNRSKPHRQVLGYSLNILVHLMQYPSMMASLEAEKEGHSILVTQLAQLMDSPVLFRSVVRVLAAGCNSVIFRKKVTSSKTLMTQLKSVAASLTRKVSKATKADLKKDLSKSSAMIAGFLRALEAASA